MGPTLSLITGTLNRRESFNRLVKSIVERTPVPWELVVSDASDEPYPDKYPEQVRILPERPRQTCVKGYNRAFREARGTWLLWLNDDAEVMPGYATASIDFMEKHPECGMGALYYAESALPYRVNEYHGMVYPNFGIFSKEFGEKIQYMDDELTMYGNDNSLAFKTLLGGKGIGTIQDAKIWHHVILDKYKVENQKFREPDANKLCEKYLPHIAEMKSVYNKYRYLIGPLVLRG